MGGSHDRKDARRHPRQRVGPVGAELRKLAIERLTVGADAGVAEMTALRYGFGRILREA
jgi:hypothetical protein